MAPLRTALTDALGLDVPIVQAPIGSATCPALAAAVADAGGLGMVAVTWRDRAQTRAVLADTKHRTDGVVGVNIVADSNAKEIPTETHVEVCLDEGVRVFSFSFGEATPYVEQIHARGGTVIQTVGSAAAATSAVDAGVDMLVAQGREAGGHVQSDVGTLPLVPRIVDAVPETPVIAAGGIADGRGIAAVLTLGAAGAWLGTRFLATEEANVHRLYRRRVVEADETDTVYSTLFDEGWPGVPHRVIENRTVSEWARADRPERQRPGAGDVVAETADGEPIRRYEDSLAVPGTTGDVAQLPLYAGQSVGLTEEVQPADALVATLAAEARTALGDVH
jgi:nitronate monooxygenase